jgi:hypothetical protein
MRILAALVLVLSVAACKKNDKFFQDYTTEPDPRYGKSFKLDSTTSESFAVEVDILWVIDNSGSMGSYQQRVIDNSALFIQQFASSSRLQWRMGLISTDEYDAPYMGFTTPVDWTTPNAVQIFNTAVARLGTVGSGYEKSFEPTIKHLKQYRNFLRPGAYLIQIFVSDELEQSMLNTTQFLNGISTHLNGNIGKYIAYGVYTPYSNDSWNKKYSEVVQRTNGKTFQLDSKDYGILLSELGKDLITKVTEVFPVVMLDQKPVLGTIQVVYKGKVLTPGKDWVYNLTHNYVEIRNTALLDARVLDIHVSFKIDRS